LKEHSQNGKKPWWNRSCAGCNDVSGLNEHNSGSICQWADTLPKGVEVPLSYKLELFIHMKILDLYILKRFLSSFFFVVIMLVAVVVVIDITEKSEDFIKSGLSWWVILRDFYLNWIPYMTNMISPLLVFIASVFITAKMASHTEVIAILSSGVSFIRFLVPFVIGSVLIALMTFVFIEWVIPRANKKSVAFENQYLKNKFYYEGKDVHLKITPTTYAYMESYNNTIRTGYKFTLETIVGHELKSKLKASRIVWQNDKKKWLLEDYMIRKFEGNKEFLVRGTTMDTVIDLHPEDFESTYRLHETLTMNELNKYIRQQQMRGGENLEAFLIEKHARHAYPFSIVILTIIGVIVSARKSRGGAGFQIAFGFLLAFIYILFVVMSRNMVSTGGMGPILASWLPNIIFSIIGFIMYKTVPR
jgi:lipopolysaccharide export system permease protein